jgi:hypothetical protein
MYLLVWIVWQRLNHDVLFSRWSDKTLAIWHRRQAKQKAHDVQSGNGPSIHQMISLFK